MTLAEGEGGHGGAGGIDLTWYVMVCLIITSVVIVLLVMCFMCHIQKWMNLSRVEQNRTDAQTQTNGENYSLHPYPWLCPPPYDSLGYSDYTPAIQPPAYQ